VVWAFRPHEDDEGTPKPAAHKTPVAEIPETLATAGHASALDDVRDAEGEGRDPQDVLDNGRISRYLLLYQ